MFSGVSKGMSGFNQIIHELNHVEKTISQTPQKPHPKEVKHLSKIIAVSEELLNCGEEPSEAECAKIVKSLNAIQGSQVAISNAVKASMTSLMGQIASLHSNFEQFDKKEKSRKPKEDKRYLKRGTKPAEVGNDSSGTK